MPPLSHSRSFTVQVNSANTAPTLAPLGSRNIDEGTPLSVTASGNDSDVPAQALSYSLDSGAPSGHDHQRQLRPDHLDAHRGPGPGTFPITVRVTDNGEPPLSTTQPLSVSVNEVNLPPVLASLPSITNHVGATIVFVPAPLTRICLAVRSVTVSIRERRRGRWWIRSTGLFQWTPSAPSTNALTLRVTDNGTPALSATQSFTIVVEPAINVFINEWLADNANTLVDPADGQFEAWFELFNPGDQPEDLSGYYLTDTLTNTTKWLIPSGTTIPAHGYLLVWADGEPGQNVPGGDLHADFSLSKSGEAIGLYGAGGVLIDAVTFGDQTTGVTEGRFPDGSASISALSQPSPRSANLLTPSNTPPTLAVIADQVIVAGSLLTFTATATDSDFPPQTLGFSLDPGAPAGASVNANDGVFAWIPSGAQAPGNYPITLRVTDNGVPPLSHSRYFHRAGE